MVGHRKRFQQKPESPPLIKSLHTKLYIISEQENGSDNIIIIFFFFLFNFWNLSIKKEKIHIREDKRENTNIIKKGLFFKKIKE